MFNVTVFAISVLNFLAIFRTSKVSKVAFVPLTASPHSAAPLLNCFYLKI